MFLAWFNDFANFQKFYLSRCFVYIDFKTLQRFFVRKIAVQEYSTKPFHILNSSLTASE